MYCFTLVKNHLTKCSSRPKTRCIVCGVASRHYSTKNASRFGQLNSALNIKKGMNLSSKTKKCAYCGSVEALTKEHIFPGGIIQRLDEDLISYNDKSDTTFKADLVIKDVCSSCNNGVLSSLDNYLCSVYDQCMSSAILPGKDAELLYEYDLLLRSLLKISFNSARGSSDGSKAVNAYRSLIPYIVGRVSKTPNVMLRLQIVTSAKRFNAEINQVEGLLEARLLRSAKIAYDGPLRSIFIVRLVAINSFWFYLIVPTKPVSEGKKRAFIKGFESWQYIHPGIPVSPHERQLHIPVEKSTYIHDSLFAGLKRKSSLDSKNAQQNAPADVLKRHAFCKKNRKSRAPLARR